MSFFLKEQEVVVASPLSGILTKNLQPLRNTKLIRRLDWGDGEVVDEVCTNDEGFFEFSGRREKLKLSPLAEFVVSQKIVALDDEEETLLWLKSKRDADLYSELGGIPKNFRCELTNEFQRMELTRGTFATSCRWDGIE